MCRVLRFAASMRVMIARFPNRDTCGAAMCGGTARGGNWAPWSTCLFGAATKTRRWVAVTDVVDWCVSLSRLSKVDVCFCVILYINNGVCLRHRPPCSTRSPARSHAHPTNMTCVRARSVRVACNFAPCALCVTPARHPPQGYRGGGCEQRNADMPLLLPGHQSGGILELNARWERLFVRSLARATSALFCPDVSAIIVRAGGSPTLRSPSTFYFMRASEQGFRCVLCERAAANHTASRHPLTRTAEPTHQVAEANSHLSFMFCFCIRLRGRAPFCACACVVHCRGARPLCMHALVSQTLHWREHRSSARSKRSCVTTSLLLPRGRSCTRSPAVARALTTLVGHPWWIPRGARRRH